MTGGATGCQRNLGDPHSLIRPVRAANTLEATFEALVRLVKVGAIPPGEKLPSERELAEQMHVSRSTLRSVLHDLQGHGYLEVRRGRYGGTFVTTAVPETDLPLEVDPSQANDILLYRSVVETGVARLAAESDLTARQRRDLRTASQAVMEAPAEHYRRLDSRLHIAIAEATGSRRLTECVIESRALVNDLLNRIPLLASNLKHSNDQHRELVEAILEGEPELAESVARNHVQGTESLLRGFLHLDR